MRVKRSTHDAGFTMVEIIISIALFAILVVAFFALFTNAFTMVRRTGDFQLDMYSRQSGLEQKVAIPPANTDASFSIDFPGGVSANVSGEVYAEDGMILFIPD